MLGSAAYFSCQLRGWHLRHHHRHWYLLRSHSRTGAAGAAAQQNADESIADLFARLQDEGVQFESKSKAGRKRGFQPGNAAVIAASRGIAADESGVLSALRSGAAELAAEALEASKLAKTIGSWAPALETIDTATLSRTSAALVECLVSPRPRRRNAQLGMDKAEDASKWVDALLDKVMPCASSTALAASQGVSRKVLDHRLMSVSWLSMKSQHLSLLSWLTGLQRLIDVDKTH